MTKKELYNLLTLSSMFSTLAPLVLTMNEMPLEELPQELMEKTENVKKDLDSLVDELREYIGNKVKNSDLPD